MDARGTQPPEGPHGEQSPWPHRAARAGAGGAAPPGSQVPQAGQQAQPGQPGQQPGGWPQPPSHASQQPQPGWQAPPPSPAYGAQPPQSPPPSPAYGAPAGTIPQQAYPHAGPGSASVPGPWAGPGPASAPMPPRRRTPDGRTTLSRVLRAWWAGRLRRLVPRGVPWTAVAFAVVLLAAWALLADILLTPGVVMAFPGEVPSRDWAHDVVGWVALLLTFGLGIPSATVLLLVARPWQRWTAVGVTVLSSAITLELVLSGPGQPLQWAAGIGGAGIVAASLAAVAALQPKHRVHLAVSAAAALMVQWGLIAWVGAIDPIEWVFLRTWTVLAFPVLVLVGFVAIVAVAASAQSMHARADRIGRRILLATWVPLVATLLALLLVLVRMGPGSMFFGDVDANLWGFGPWQSWPHAAIVGGLVLWLVARTGRRPVQPRGHGLVIGVLAIVAGWWFLSFFVTYLLLQLVTDEANVASAMVATVLPQGNLGPVPVLAVLLVPLLLRRYRQTTGRVMAIVTLAVAVPLQAWFIVSTDLDLPVTRFAASPSQVVLALLVGTLVLSIWNVVRRHDVVDRHLLLRLALVPVLTLHAGQLLPGVWKDDLEQALVVALSLLGLLVLGAPRTGTKEGDASAIVMPFATQVVVLGSVIVARTMGQAIDDESTTYGVLYLTIPLAAVLCCRLEDPSDAWTQRASAVDLQMMRRGRAPGPVVAVGGGWGGPATGAAPQPQPQPQAQPWGGRPQGPGPAGPGPQPWQQPPPHR